MGSYYNSGLSESSLFNWPCWEYLSVFPTEPLIDWKDRWQKAGGPPLVNARFLAPKIHAVWKNLGDPDILPDALGNPFPPYVNGSGFSIVERKRQECIDLGIIDPSYRAPERKSQLLTQMFGDPSKATASAIRAKRKALESALEMLRQTESQSKKPGK
jgi:hypothetical protein